MFFILQNKMEAISQWDELLWKSIFGLSTKAIEKKIVNVKDDYNSKESLGVLSPQGNMSLIHANAPDTLEAEQSRLTNSEVGGEEKETSVNDNIVLAPQIEEK